MSCAVRADFDRWRLSRRLPICDPCRVSQKAIFRAILTVPILLLAGSAAADSVAPWKPDGTSGGLWVESREVQGSSFHEIRITAVSSIGLVRMCDAIFGKGREVQSTVRFKKREVLR